MHVSRKACAEDPSRVVTQLTKLVYLIGLCNQTTYILGIEDMPLMDVSYGVSS